MADEPQADATPARQWPVTLTLKQPIDMGSERIESLKFRDGRMGDLKGTGMVVGSMPSYEQLAVLASRMCAQPAVVIEKLSAEDWSEVQQVAIDFFVRCHSAGKTP